MFQCLTQATGTVLNVCCRYLINILACGLHVSWFFRFVCLKRTGMVLFFQKGQWYEIIL